MILSRGGYPRFGGVDMVSATSRRITIWIIIAVVVVAAIIVAAVLLSGGGGGGGGGGGY
jgi:hypothetical protein